MANTTNFGWETPDDTDLVKDGAAAIRTLGSAIDTSLVDLKGGTTGQVLAKASDTDMDFTWSADAAGIPPTIFDAKGDLIAASAADTAARLAVGANGTVLTADSGETTGLKWASPAFSSPGFTLINAGGTALTGATTITVSGLGSYNELFIYIDLASSANSNAGFSYQFNTSSTNHYFWGNRLRMPSAYTPGQFDERTVSNGAEIPFANIGNDAARSAQGYINVPAVNTTSIKPFTSVGGVNPGSTNSHWGVWGGGYFDAASAISTFSFKSDSGNFDGGTIYIYGR